jgi:hypothetical protein
MTTKIIDLECIFQVFENNHSSIAHKYKISLIINLIRIANIALYETLQKNPTINYVPISKNKLFLTRF